MGLFRKTMSLGTAGLVDFRSDKERTAAYTKAAKKEARKQTQLMRQQAAAQTLAALRGRSEGSEEPAGPGSVADELAKLAALRDSGVLSEDEFAAQKARLLS
jgi:hypothetical protein